MVNPFSKTEAVPVTLFVSLFQDEGRDTALQIRARVSEKQLMKTILRSAYKGEQAIFFLSFKDKAHALNTLQQHGLVLPETKDGVTKYRFVD